MPKPSDIIETEDPKRKSLKVTLLIEEVEPVECTFLFLFFSDRPRKEGGGRGNIGNVHDELNKEKY